MSKLLGFRELQVSLRTETPSSIKTLQSFIFGDESDRKKNHRIGHFTGFLRGIDSDDYKDKIQQTTIFKLTIS